MRRISAAWLLWLSLLWLPVQAAVTLDGCQDLQPASLRQSLTELIQTQLDAQALTADAAQLSALWVKLGVDEVIAAETDKAVQYIHDNSGYWERYGSTWGLESADRFTADIVNRVFNSPAFSDKMQVLIAQYGDATQGQLEQVLAKAWEQGHQCLSTFIGGRYGRALAYQYKQAGEQGIRSAVQGLQQTQVGGVTSHSSALSGVAVLVGKKILQKMLTNLIARISGGVAQRIGGAIASRFIPVLGWGLLLYDFYAAADGILPEVAQVLKSSETRTEVLAQLKQGIEAEFKSDKLAQEVAAQVHSQWQEFHQRHQRVLDLAEQSAEFKRVLSDLAPEQLDRFSSVVGILLEAVGTEQTVRYAVGGKLLSLMRLPTEADELLADTKSPDVALAWHKSLGESDAKLNTLVRLGIHRRKQPGDFTGQQLAALLTLDNKPAVDTLLALDAFALEQALSLPADALRTLALRTDTQGWQTLVWYRQQLAGDTSAQEHFTRVVVQNPSVLELFAAQATRLMVTQAKDKIAAIDEVANLSDGWFGGVLGGVLTLLQWVVGIVALLVVIWLWPLLRLMLWPLWALLRGVVPSKPVKPEKTVE